jgi:hypothetical protein
MRTRWPGFAAFHSGHVAVVELISGVWRRRRSFARCVGSVERHLWWPCPTRPPIPSRMPLPDAQGRPGVVPRTAG